MTEPRYHVLLVRGYLSVDGGRGGGGREGPGVSATVIDRLLDREVVTYRSEQVRWVPGGREGRVAEAIRRAKAKAAELNAAHETERSADNGYCH